MWFWLLALAGLGLDLATKELVFTRFASGEDLHVIRGCFTIHRQEGLNRGALFGLANSPETGAIANRVFAAISGLAILGIVCWSLRSAFASDRWLCLALGCILGGAAGNFYDRVVHGGVRDFLWVYYERGPGDMPFNWPVFNLADAWLVIGAGLLLFQAFFLPHGEKLVASGSSTQPVGNA
jgi:lipoprotein signal peptidase